MLYIEHRLRNVAVTHATPVFTTQTWFGESAPRSKRHKSTRECFPVERWRGLLSVLTSTHQEVFKNGQPRTGLMGFLCRHYGSSNRSDRFGILQVSQSGFTFLEHSRPPSESVNQDVSRAIKDHHSSVLMARLHQKSSLVGNEPKRPLR